jgi:ribonuclease HII
MIAGIDEVGRGCLAGPVVSAAVIFPEGFSHPLMRDSKKMSEKKRDEAFKVIYDNAISVSIGISEPDEIDRINILQATFVSMKKAINGLSVVPSKLLIDGDKFPGHNGIPFECIIKGDGKVQSISAASIIAKVTRDKIMKDLSKEFPAYKWDSNVGYGTKDHMDAIEKNGLCAHHRKTFCSRFNSPNSLI